MVVDPSRNAYRQDVADIALAGQVIASHYAEPWVRKCKTLTVLATALEEQSDDRLEPGDLFAVLDCGRGSAWGYRLSDHQVGYVDAAALTSAEAN